MAKTIAALLLSLFFVAAAAHVVQAAEPEIYITTRLAEDVGLHEVVVSITNNPGIAGYNLVIYFDNTKLTPVSISEAASLRSGMIFTSNVAGASSESLAEMSAVTAVWGGAEDDTGSGVIYTILFSAAPTATGTTELILSSRGIGNSDGETVDFILTGATIDFGNGTGSVAGSPTGGQYNEGGIGTAAILTMILSTLAALGMLIILLARKRKQKKAAPNRYRDRRQFSNG